MTLGHGAIVHGAGSSDSTARAELVESADAAALDLDGRAVHTSVDHELAGWGSWPHPSTTRPIKLTIKAGDVMKGVSYDE